MGSQPLFFSSSLALLEQSGRSLRTVGFLAPLREAK